MLPSCCCRKVLQRAARYGVEPALPTLSCVVATLACSLAHTVCVHVDVGTCIFFCL